ncbi:MAG: anti-sigma factor family protein [Bryobacteraceae bacterium]
MKPLSEVGWMLMQMNNHVSEEQLILYYYGEADVSPDVQQHLVGCEECRGQYQALQRTLNSVEAAPVPERGSGYENEVWRRLGIARERRSWRSWLAPGKLAPVALMAGLLAVAFLAGRYTPQAEPPDMAGSSAHVRERILLGAVRDHLDRSQMLLAELVNTATAEGVNITGEREAAESLLLTNRLYRQSAQAVGENGIAALLDDLERVLLDVAHGPDQVSGEEMDEIRGRIEGESLLFKVRVMGARLRELETLPAAFEDESTSL